MNRKVSKKLLKELTRIESELDELQSDMPNDLIDEWKTILDALAIPVKSYSSLKQLLQHPDCAIREAALGLIAQNRWCNEFEGIVFTIAKFDKTANVRETAIDLIGTQYKNSGDSRTCRFLAEICLDPSEPVESTRRIAYFSLICVSSISNDRKVAMYSNTNKSIDIEFVKQFVN